MCVCNRKINSQTIMCVIGVFTECTSRRCELHKIIPARKPCATDVLCNCKINSQTIKMCVIFLGPTLPWMRMDFVPPHAESGDGSYDLCLADDKLTASKQPSLNFPSFQDLGSKHAIVAGPAPLQKCVGDFCCATFGGFCWGFSWSIFLGIFPTKLRIKSGDKIRKKSGGSKNINPRKIRSANGRA